MTKSEFVDQVADRAGLTRRMRRMPSKRCSRRLRTRSSAAAMSTFSGFGKFSVSARGAREGRNPATGEKIQIAASKVPKFTAGAALKKAVK